jgi:uncharacterized protein YbjT (DUF2867 family)
MKVAITGATGFVGRHLVARLTEQAHTVVPISRGIDRRVPPPADLHAIGLASEDALAEAMNGCDAVAHLAGINREIGAQTFKKVHVEGTRNVIRAAQRAGVKKLILLSFLRARPACGSPYHESKWEAEELVRRSGIDYTIFKSGVIYGRGDHMLDHISHALHTFPIFLFVGFRKLSMRPLAASDVGDVMARTLVEGRLRNQTVPITGPEEMTLQEAVRRVARVIGKRRVMFPAPVWVHRVMAEFFERTMRVPLAAKAQIQILSESLCEPMLAFHNLPADLLPRTAFTDEQIRQGLPEPGGFGLKDCLWRMPWQHARSS